MFKKIKWFNAFAMKVEGYFIEKADETLKKQSENGKKGGRPKKDAEIMEQTEENPIETERKPEKNPIETQAKPTETETKPNANLNVNDNVTDNDTVNDNEDVNVTATATVSDTVASV